MGKITDNQHPQMTCEPVAMAMSVAGILKPRPEVGDCRHSNVYRSFRPIAIITKLFGLFPVSGVLRESGEFRFRWRSVDTFYSFVVMTWTIGALIYSTVSVMAGGLDDSMDEFSYHIAHIILIIITLNWLLTEILTARMAPKYVTYFNQWKCLEESNAALGLVVSPSPRESCALIVVILLFQSSTAITDCAYFFTTVPSLTLTGIVLYLIYLVPIVTDVIPNAVFCFFCLVFRVRFWQLRLRLQEALENPSADYAQDLVNLRTAYKSLVALLRGINRIIAPSMFIFFLAHTSQTCVGLYYIIVSIITSRAAVSYFFVMICLYSFNSLVRIIVVCASAHCLTRSAKGVQFALMDLDTTSKQMKEEIQFFLSITMIASTDISVFGLFRVNSRTLTTLLGIIITYLLVLVQFQLSYFGEEGDVKPEHPAVIVANPL